MNNIVKNLPRTKRTRLSHRTTFIVHVLEVDGIQTLNDFNLGELKIV